MPRAEQAELATQLEQARARISEITAELEVAHRTPLPLSDALRRAHAMVDAAKATLPPLALDTLIRDDRGPPRIDLSLTLAEQPTALLVALAGEQIAQKLEAQLKSLYSCHGLRTLPAAERQRLVERLEDQLHIVQVSDAIFFTAARQIVAECLKAERPDAIDYFLRCKSPLEQVRRALAEPPAAAAPRQAAPASAFEATARQAYDRIFARTAPADGPTQLAPPRGSFREMAWPVGRS